MWSGLLHAFLDLGCMALVAATGFEDQLGKALIFALAANFCSGLFALGAQSYGQIAAFSYTEPKYLPRESERKMSVW